MAENERESSGNPDEGEPGTAGAISAPWPTSERRFLVGLSFAGERRDFVERVASLLGVALDNRRVLYDRFHEHEFAEVQLDVTLAGLYEREAELLVVFLCPEYARKQWCLLEFESVQRVLRAAEASRIMLLSFGDPGDLSALGLSRGDGYIDVAGREPRDITERILERLRAVVTRATTPPAQQHRSRYHYAGTLPTYHHTYVRRSGDQELARFTLDTRRERASFVMIHGRSGSGKSSMLHRMPAKAHGIDALDVAAGDLSTFAALRDELRGLLSRPSCVTIDEIGRFAVQGVEPLVALMCCLDSLAAESNLCVVACGPSSVTQLLEPLAAHPAHTDRWSMMWKSIDLDAQPFRQVEVRRLLEFLPDKTRDFCLPHVAMIVERTQGLPRDVQHLCSELEELTEPTATSVEEKVFAYASPARARRSAPLHRRP